MPAPMVTGISPNEGVPGTKLTIRGENLGNVPEDVKHVIVGIHDVRSTVNWCSPKKLTVYTPMGEGELNITVCTLSGGYGSSTVIYIQKIEKFVDPQTPVSYWPPDEAKSKAIIEWGKSTQPRTVQSDMMLNTLFRDSGKLSAPLSDEALKKLIPDCTGSTELTDEKFNPSMYLLKFHKSKSYSELLNMYKRLQEQMHTQNSDEPVAVVKANLFTIFQCLFKLQDLKQELQQDRLSENKVEKNLENTVADCREHSHQLFQDVLKTKDLTDSARTTLAVMQRFKFLFNLPHVIRENIAKNEYNIVINHYLRVKDLFGHTEVAIFKAVYLDVEDVMTNFKEFLKTKLLSMPNKYEDVKETIRYLMLLKVPYDPAWICLEGQKAWILEQLDTIKKNHSKDTGTNTRPTIVTMVDNLCRIMLDNYSELWRLGSTYISGQLFDKEILSQRNENDFDEKASWESMNHEIFQRFSTYLRGSLLDSSSGDLVVTGWVPHCISEVRNCLSKLPLAEFDGHIKTLITLLSCDLRKVCIKIIFRRAEFEIDNLKFKEVWNTEISDENGVHTQLPLLFENIGMDALTTSKDFIKAKLILEEDLFSYPEVEKEFPVWLSTMLSTFARCLKQLVDVLEAPDDEDNSPNEESRITSNQLEIEGITKPRGLLLLVNNCQFATDCVLPRLINAYRTNHYIGLDRAETMFKSTIKNVYSTALSRYIELKAAPILEPIRSNLCIGDYSWKHAPPPVGCRYYVKRIIRDLNQVYAEVLVSPRCASDTMQILVTRVIAHLEKVYTELGCAGQDPATAWSRDGHIQASLDLKLVETAVSGHLSAEAKSRLRVLQSSIGKRWNTAEIKLMDEIINREKSRNRLILEGLAYIE